MIYATGCLLISSIWLGLEIYDRHQRRWDLPLPGESIEIDNSKYVITEIFNDQISYKKGRTTYTTAIKHFQRRLNATRNPPEIRKAD